MGLRAKVFKNVNELTVFPPLWYDKYSLEIVENLSRL